MSLLRQLARSQGVDSVSVPDMASRRRAIIDIGSNSVRLVVYDGPARAPFLLFNEKVMAGLGGSLSATGRIDDTAMQRGIDALVRFASLARVMDVQNMRCIATAAVRDADNGKEFVSRALSEAGLTIEILSGEEEGCASGFGVIGAIPGADGVVADLGGGSLELARVRDGTVEKIVSLPLGVLRLPALRDKGKMALTKYVARALRDAGWLDVGRGLPLYMVGGSWRALAHLDMHVSQNPLAVIHQYRMEAERAAHLVRVTAHMGKARLKKIRAISSTRAATLANAAALLAVLVRHMGTSELIVSAHGLREGLLYERLSPEERALDPLLVAAEAEGQAQGRFPGHGEQIDSWISGLFRNDPPEWARLRRAACLLADVAWRANPDFRAERGMEIALHSNWAGIDCAGRVMLAQALFTSFGGGNGLSAGLADLVEPDVFARATQWGLAIRLAQRLSGGTVEPLEHSRIGVTKDGKTLMLELLNPGFKGEAVGRRLKTLAQAAGLGWQISVPGRG